jgi:conjugal transfer pilus assembly protein TraW
MSRFRDTMLPIATFTALLAVTLVRAEDVGTVGPTYAIREPHLLTAIEQQLQAKDKSGELARLEDEAKRRIVDAIEHPRPLPGITRTETARSFYFDPSIVVRENITDAKGNLLVPAGTRANPLEVVSLSKQLLFFDGSDARQVEWARQLIARYEGKVKPILVAGSYLALMQRWHLPVYFDQQGVLTRKLGITHVPALVSQEGLELRIDELTL